MGIDGVLVQDLKLVRYPEYKDSGVEWLGEIPVGWEMKQGRRIHQCKKEINRQYQESTVLSLTLRGVVNNDLDNPEGLIPRDYKTYQLFNKNDLVFKLIDLENIKTSRVGIVHNNGIMSSAYIRICINQNHYIPKYYYYYYFNLYLLSLYNKIGAGVRSTLNPDDLLEINVLCFEKREQQRIAEFLDKKTSQIDQAVAQKEKMIELLKEYQQVTINNAVTKGLDCNVKLKPSGIDWLGDIPIGWEVKKLKYCCKINQQCLTETEDYDLLINYVDISSTNFEQGITKIENYRFKDAPSRARRKVKFGDTIISTVRTYLKAIDFISGEKSSLIFSTGFAVLSPYVMIYNKFFNYCIYSDHFIDQINQEATGVSYPAVTADKLIKLCILYPSSLLEQQRIADFLDKKTSQINESIKIQQQQIQKLKEYKATLINSAVTGKIRI